MTPKFAFVPLTPTPSVDNKEVGNFLQSWPAQLKVVILPQKARLLRNFTGASTPSNIRDISISRKSSLFLHRPGNHKEVIPGIDFLLAAPLKALLASG